MNKICALLVSVSAFISLHATERFTERVFLYTDKDNYVAGEDIWISFCATDESFQPSSLSKVGYIEICDTQKPYMQLKLSLKGGYGSGCLRIPENIPSGVYQLAAYTRYMRNEGEDVFFKKLLPIVNVTNYSELDRIELIPPHQKDGQRSQQVSTMLVETDKTIYGNREEVTLLLKDIPEDIISLSVSVSGSDSVVYFSGNDKRDYAGNNLFATSSSIHSEEWIPEYEGHIIMGKIIPPSENTQVNYEFLTSNLGFLGKDIRYIQGQNNPANETAGFYTGEIYGRQEIVASASSAEGIPYRIEIISPFSECLPESLPALRVCAEDRALMDRAVNAQLKQIFQLDSLGNKIPFEDSYYNLQSHLSYDLDEYTRFPTLEETFIEFVRRVIVRKVDGKRRIKVLIEGDKRFNSGSTLVLLDGIPIYDHEDMLRYNPRHIKKIDIYSGKYIFGGEPFECIVDFKTFRGNLPAMQLSNHTQLVEYECPRLPEEFIFPAYDDDKSKEARKPDFRHTLYWNPCVRFAPGQSEKLSFYTSDLKGSFKVTAEGITATGKVVYGRALFEVK